MAELKPPPDYAFMHKVEAELGWPLSVPVRPPAARRAHRVARRLPWALPPVVADFGMYLVAVAAVTAFLALLLHLAGVIR